MELPLTEKMFLSFEETNLLSSANFLGALKIWTFLNGAGSLVLVGALNFRGVDSVRVLTPNSCSKSQVVLNLSRHCGRFSRHSHRFS